MAVKAVRKRSVATATEMMVYERQAQICRAFANPIRLQIIDLVSKGEVALSEMQEVIGISKANLSQHISILKSSGVLHVRRDGKKMHCSLAIPEVKEACHLVRKVLQAQIEATRKMLV
jgi:DNA-binding transcriptional ArsR family regulator